MSEQALSVGLMVSIHNAMQPEPPAWLPEGSRRPS